MHEQFGQQLIIINTENDLSVHHPSVKWKHFYFSFEICSLISHNHTASPSYRTSFAFDAIPQSEISRLGSRAAEKRKFKTFN